MDLLRDARIANSGDTANRAPPPKCADSHQVRWIKTDNQRRQTTTNNEERTKMYHTRNTILHVLLSEVSQFTQTNASTLASARARTRPPSHAHAPELDEQLWLMAYGCVCVTHSVVFVLSSREHQPQATHTALSSHCADDRRPTTGDRRPKFYFSRQSGNSTIKS